MAATPKLNTARCLLLLVTFIATSMFRNLDRQFLPSCLWRPETLDSGNAGSGMFQGLEKVKDVSKRNSPSCTGRSVTPCYALTNIGGAFTIRKQLKGLCFFLFLSCYDSVSATMQVIRVGTPDIFQTNFPPSPYNVEF